MLGQVALIATGITIARTFGPEGRGVWVYAGTLIAFAIAAAEGIRAAVAHQAGAKGHAMRDVWGLARAVAIAAGLAGSATFGALWLANPDQPAYLFNALAFPFALYVQSIGVIYQLRDRIETSNIINTATINVAGPLVTFVLVAFLHASVQVALAVWVTSYALAALIASAGLPDLLAARPRLRERTFVRDQVTFASKAALSAGVTFLSRRVDVLVVAACLGARELGIYTLAVATAELLFQVSNALTWAATGRLTTRPLDQAVRLLARIVRTLVATQAVGAAALFVVGPWLIVHVYGQAFAESGLVLRLLLPGVVCYSADAALSYFIAVRAGRPGLLFGFEGSFFALGAVLSLVGVKFFGSGGVAVADTATFVVSYVVKLRYVARTYGLSARDVLIVRPSDVPPRLRAVLSGVAQTWAPVQRSIVSSVRFNVDS